VAEENVAPLEENAERKHSMDRKRKATSLDDDATFSALTSKSSEALPETQSPAASSPEPASDAPLEYIPLVRDTNNLMGFVMFDQDKLSPKSKDGILIDVLFWLPGEANPPPLSELYKMRKVWISLLSGCVEGWHGEWEGKKVLTWKAQVIRTDVDEENPSTIFLIKDAVKRAFYK
jgi:hypothetical protein